jgi:PDDEXK-like domain of unknown function (DUF3799)
MTHSPPRAAEGKTMSTARLRDLSDGIHYGLPESAYHERSGDVWVSNTGLKHAARSPAHFCAWLDGDDSTDSAALAFGRIFHAAALEPERFARTYASEPDFGDMRTKAAKALRDEWREANAGRESVAAGDYGRITSMVAALRAHSRVSRLLAGGASEVTALWTDSATELRCKARADYYVPARNIIVDLKSTEDASEEAFVRTVERYRYHWQAALYRAGFAVATGGEPPRFVFVAVEKAAPYGVGVFSLSDEWLARGAAQVGATMARLGEASKAGQWGSYDEAIRVLSMPKWAA